MNATELSVVPMAYAAQLAFELNQARGECSSAANILVQKHPLNEAALDECAQLDEALAHAHRCLRAALKRIQAARNRRNSTGRAGSPRF